MTRDRETVRLILLVRYQCVVLDSLDQGGYRRMTLIHCLHHNENGKALCCDVNVWRVTRRLQVPGRLCELYTIRGPFLDSPETLRAIFGFHNPFAS